MKKNLHPVINDNHVAVKDIIKGSAEQVVGDADWVMCVRFSQRFIMIKLGF